MSLIAIGDIHGCARTLDALLEQLAPTADDELVFVGDYIDRGPDSRGVIDRLLTLRKEISCTFLRGNHEAMMLDFLRNGDSRLWYVNGGRATLESYGNAHPLPEDHIAFVRETLLYFETSEYFFVHAGARPELSIAENVADRDEQVFLWERDHLRLPGEKLAWEKTVVCGHTPVEMPINEPHLINIDTGCVYAGRAGYGTLTAVRLPDREFVSVPYQE
jgi:serine/threonine protein phosphatase 1